MKTSLIRKVIPALILATLSITAAHAKDGDKAGGGGEPMEIDIDMIRADLVAWINAGGARDLKLPGGVSYSEYTQAMLQILTPHAVVLAFVDQDSNTDPELSVKVAGQEKTCRGFISRNDARPHILCHRGRYKNASEGERYQLIHHEYAGLAQVEQNIGASSDYSISKQISDYLVPVTVLRLAVRGIVKPKEVPTSCLLHVSTTNYYETAILDHRPPAAFVKLLETKGYKLTKQRKKAAITMSAEFSRYSPRSSTDTYLNLSIWHRKGFHIDRLIRGHGVIPDPRKAEIKSKMESAKSVAEYQALQTELRTGVFNDTPDNLLDGANIPTCEEFYGKKALTLTNGQQSE